MVGEVGVPTCNYFNVLACPTDLKAAFDDKRQFPELSNHLAVGSQWSAPSFDILDVKIAGGLLRAAAPRTL
jgi:hypothetical protein